MNGASAVLMCTDATALDRDELAWVGARRDFASHGRVVRMNAYLPPGEATPRRLSRSIGFVPAGPLGLGGGVRAVWLGALGALRRGRAVFGARLAGRRTERCVSARVVVAAQSKS
jgi:hypothetical protein